MEPEKAMDRAAAASTLQWWADAGVDVLVGEYPRDWLQPKAATAPSVAEPEEEALPEQLALFRDHLVSSERLAFHAPGAPRICPSGDPASGLMILTDMPSGEDCSAGVLISGAAGELLDKMLAAIGRDRSSIYLAALSCLRSPDGRFTPETVRQCAALARHHIGLVQPKAALLFGDAAAKAMVGQPVAQARARWHEIATPQGPVKALITFSPAYLLNQPNAKRRAWEDLQMLIQELAP